MAAAFFCRSMLSSGREAEAARRRAAFALLTEADDRPGIRSPCSTWRGRAVHRQPGSRTRSARTMRGDVAGVGFASLRARTLQPLGIARVDLGDLKVARAALQEGLSVSVDLGDRFVILVGLSGFAGLAAKSGSTAGAPAGRRAQAYRDACAHALPEPIRRTWTAGRAVARRSAPRGPGCLPRPGR